MQQNQNSSPDISTVSTSLYAEQPEIPPHAPLLDDLYGVGPEKPLGYLQVTKIMMRGEDPNKVASLSRERGLSTYVREYSADEIRRGRGDQRGDLYVYDERALEDLLGRNRSVLDKSQWPTDPGEFVSRVAAEHVDMGRQPELHTLIARAFNDSRPEMREPTLHEPAVATRGLLARLGFRRRQRDL